MGSTQSTTSDTQAPISFDINSPNIRWKFVHGPNNTLQIIPAGQTLPVGDPLCMTLVSNASGKPDRSSEFRIGNKASFAGTSEKFFSPKEVNGNWTFTSAVNKFSMSTQRFREECFMTDCQSASNCPNGSHPTSHRDHKHPICFKAGEDHQQCCTNRYDTRAIALLMTDPMPGDTSYHYITTGGWSVSEAK